MYSEYEDHRNDSQSETLRDGRLDSYDSALSDFYSCVRVGFGGFDEAVQGYEVTDTIWVQGGAVSGMVTTRSNSICDSGREC